METKSDTMPTTPGDTMSENANDGDTMPPNQGDTMTETENGGGTMPPNQGDTMTETENGGGTMLPNQGDTITENVNDGGTMQPTKKKNFQTKKVDSKAKKQEARTIGEILFSDDKSTSSFEDARNQDEDWVPPAGTNVGARRKRGMASSTRAAKKSKPNIDEAEEVETPNIDDNEAEESENK